MPAGSQTKTAERLREPLPIAASVKRSGKIADRFCSWGSTITRALRENRSQIVDMAQEGRVRGTISRVTVGAGMNSRRRDSNPHLRAKHGRYSHPFRTSPMPGRNCSVLTRAMRRLAPARWLGPEARLEFDLGGIRFLQTQFPHGECGRRGLSDYCRNKAFLEKDPKAHLEEMIRSPQKPFSLTVLGIPTRRVLASTCVIFHKLHHGFGVSQKLSILLQLGIGHRSPS